jgi:hypothetical protein
MGERTGVVVLWGCGDGYKTTTTAIHASVLPRPDKRAIQRPWITVTSKSEAVSMAMDSRVGVPGDVPVGWLGVRIWG